MRTERIYKFNELSKEAQARAIEHHRQTYHEIHGQEDIFNSLEALFNEASVTIANYELGMLCDRVSGIKVDMEDDIAELTGKRALAWLENNLFYKLRIPYKGPERWQVAQYGASYRAGKIKPCPLTGVCFDEDYIEALIDSIKTGSTMKESFVGLSDEYARLLECEWEHQNADEYISDFLSANDYEFLEDGTAF